MKIECDDCCNTCQYLGECELLLPNHQTLHKLNNRILNTTFELDKVNECIQHSLHNRKLNYPLYIGASLQILEEKQKSLEEELYHLTKKREDILKLLKRRLNK